MQPPVIYYEARRREIEADLARRLQRAARQEAVRQVESRERLVRRFRPRFA
jgi:hypothetical protein